MANITYTVNQDNPESITGFEQFSQTDTQLVSKFEINNLFIRDTNYIELHILNLVDQILYSEYNYKYYKELGNAQSAGKEGASVLTVDPVQDVNRYGYGTGDVKLLYHFLNDLYTSNNKQTTFFIQEISPDRTELKLQTFELTNEEIIKHTQEIRDKLTTQSYFNEFRLNFKNNNLIIGVNVDTLKEGSNSVIVVKLYEPLPADFVIKDTLTIVETVSDSIAYTVDSTLELLPETQLHLRPANFNLDLIDTENIPTAYLSYDELFSYPVDNSNSQVYSLLNEKGVELSIDHTDYSNFIQFSSAYERLANFKYKIQLIENYSTNLSQIKNTTLQSIGTTGSTQYYENLTQGILNNFDHYERFLYYESSSYSWPKSNNSKPYINTLSTDPTAIDWYANQLIQATSYDSTNLNAVANSIPTFLRDDSSNINYTTFIHMIGQHFDNLWIYGKGVSDKYNADNRLDFGVSKDLIAEVLKNFGIKLYTSNKSVEDLFSSFIGQAYQSGSEVINTYVTGSVTGSNTPIQPSSFDNYQREVYKRIYHNLPLLLKSKGTERGLRALINCFGIPSNILDIKTYGGRSIEERPFYGDAQHYTSSLGKIRLDNTGSIVEGNTLSRYTSIVKRDYKYTDDLHVIEVGFSPTDNIDTLIISSSRATGSLSSFNLDDYLGDPGNLLENTYSNLTSTGVVSNTLEKLTETLVSGSTNYNVQDFVRLIKFFDNTIFKMVKDFIPARSIADTGIVIKPHILHKSKAKNVAATVTEHVHTGSIDTAFISGSDGKVFGAQDTYATSYVETIQTPLGLSNSVYHSHAEAKYDGELEGSVLAVSSRDLNISNLFKIPTFITNTFTVNRWLNNDGVCILNPLVTNQQQGVFYQGGTFYLDSGSYNQSNFYTGLSQNMSYEITSSNQGTSSFAFPFNTSNYANYSMHYLTASNNSVPLQDQPCSSSFSIQVAVCDLETNPTNFRNSVKLTEQYDVASWFNIGSQNNLANIFVEIVNDRTNTVIFPVSPQTGNIQDAGLTTVLFTGILGDTYTITISDNQIPITCTLNYDVIAGQCNILRISPTDSRNENWVLGRDLGTVPLVPATPDTIFNYGLSRFFIGADPDNTPYRVQVYDTTTTHLDITFTPTTPITSEQFYPIDNYYYGFTCTYSYVQQPGLGLNGNIALFKIENGNLFGPEEALSIAAGLSIKVTAVEDILNCTPYVIVKPTPVDGGGGNICCFTGDTLVTLENNTTKRIDAIQVGDKVLSYNEITNEQLTSTVLAITSPTKNDIVKYTLSDGKIIEATTEHPIWVISKGWSSYSPIATEQDHDMQVALIQEGDILLTQEGAQVEIVSMELDPNREYEQVYNFKLEGHYTYYANGVLVHNKTELQVEQCIYEEPPV